MTTQDYYNLPIDQDGWRTLSNGNKFKIGSNVIINDNVIIGNGVFIDDNVVLGSHTKIGNHTKIGKNSTTDEYTNIGYYITIGRNAKIGRFSKIVENVIINDNTIIGNCVYISEYSHICNDVIIGNSVKIGNDTLICNRTKIGNDVIIGSNCHINIDAIIGDNTKLGDNVKTNPGVTTDQLNEYFISTFPEKTIFWKWVTEDLYSPQWGNAVRIKYNIGNIIEEPNAVRSDIQCDVGLHVFRVGLRPEFVGLTRDRESLVCLEVEVDRSDICFGGLPGNDMKIRVKKLKVIRKIDVPKI